jgi:hypothetical protein
MIKRVRYDGITGRCTVRSPPATGLVTVRRRLGVVGAVLALVAGLVLVVAPAANAVPPQKPVNWSFYVTSASTSTAYTLGCNQGTSDKPNKTNSLVALDFGAQSTNNAGTYLPINHVYLSYAQVEAYAEQFAYGYWSCTGSDTTSIDDLAISTNNSGSYVNSTAGSAWAGVVNTVTSWVATHAAGQEHIEGGDDIESWGSFAAVNSWISGYAAGTSRLYLDFGSADGCPQTTNSGGNGGGCGAGWNQYDYWYVSWGQRLATTMPEIYYVSQAMQWGQLAKYGASYRASEIIYEGPLDENDRAPSTLTASQAWADLWSYVPQTNFAYAGEQH